MNNYIGTILKNGYFSGDHIAVIEAYGKDWLVYRGVEDSKPYFVNFNSFREIEDWIKKNLYNIPNRVETK